ncbi:BppU family phage baseplate upper protein (plasmid) [Clostridium perfringens]|uniref:BppU family phage baseplate upper protein n=1 Tax=Clostridium perfringens TaxID=1502 RepID=UPI001CC9590F|nr:BppU family phage baseplate upper protein [Clostridium perfringens]UBK45594.1 BppU family phage baseplate upper protein [Clostridium perfringens]UBK54332.1 BppU family phage baseplate upper protein [Clostridium perfringens]
MSEIGLNINVDSYNNEGIKTIKGNNNAEIYKLYILKNKRRLSLVDKTVKLGYVMAGTTKGDIIENLNITNVEQGEITFPITNRISKQDGVYSCQLAIYGADGFLEHTATFGLTVEANIFTKIAGEIADSKDFTYLENILDKASKLSEKLKENTSSATNANSNLESNIIEANNINSKLLENTSTATSLNKNLESNIDLAKEVKETIKDLDTKNIEATSKIERLEGLNAKAEELSNNINEALPVKDALVKNIESAKVANTNLVATNNDAKAKKTDLDNSLEEAKKYISGLDGSKNPVQMQLDINELKNGLKSNQSLSYEGSSIAANNTLEGRTEGMRIVGRTLVNLKGNVKNRVSTWVDNDDKYTLNLESGHGQPSILYNLTHVLKENQKYTVIVNLVEYTSGVLHFSFMNSDGNKLASTTELVAESKGLKKFVFTINNTVKAETLRLLPRNGINNIYSISKNILILEGDWTNKDVPSYFEGIESFGEQEGNKISILSSGKNIYNWEDLYIYKPEEKWRVIKVPNIPKFELGKTYKVSYKTTESVALKIILTYENGEDAYSSSESPLVIVENKGKITGFRFYIEESDYSTNKKFIITNIQIEEGSQATTYEPYKEDKKDILLKEQLRENDVLYEDNGQVKVSRKVKQYLITGNETIIVSKTREKTICFNVNFTNDGVDNSLNVMCNNFLVTASCYSYDVEGFFGTKKGIFCSILKSKLTTQDVEGVKAWLKANPTKIVYQLAEPTTEIVENCVDIDLDTFEEKTYFNILNSLQGTLDFKVPSNIGSSLQNLAKEVNNIWDVINNLLVPSIVKANGNIAMIKLNNNLK